MPKYFNQTDVINFIKEDNNTINNKYSPIHIEDNKVLFYLDGHIYEIDKKSFEIDQIMFEENLDHNFRNATKVIDLFNFNENSMDYYGQHNISIVLDKKPQLNIDGRSIEENDREVLNKIYLYRNQEELDLVQTALENAENFVVLDFVTSVTEGNVTINFIRYGNNVYVNEVNSLVKTNKFQKVQLQRLPETLESLSKITSFNFSTIVKDLLEGEEAKQAEYSEQIELFHNRIAFLKDQRGRLAEENKENEYIKTADKLLSDEIRKIEEEIEEIKDLSNGYVSGRLVADFQDYSKDSQFKILAVDFTNKGHDDEIICYSEDSDSEVMIPKALLQLSKVDSIN